MILKTINRGECGLLSKARNLGEVSARGGFHLFWGVAFSSIISAIGIIIVGRILSPEEMGVVSIVINAPNLIKTFRDFGIDQATIKFTALYRSDNKFNKVKQVLATEIIFEVIIGLILMVISFFLSDFIASVLGREEIVPLLQIASVIIFSEALLKAAQAAFTGYEKMGFYSISLVIQSTVKTCLMALLVLTGFGALGAIIGDTISYIVAGLLSILILYFVIYNRIQNQKERLQIVIWFSQSLMMQVDYCLMIELDRKKRMLLKDLETLRKKIEKIREQMQAIRKKTLKTY